MFKAVTPFLTSLFFLIGCASDVATDYDSSTNFSAFKTYQYQENSADPVSLDRARIKKAVDNEMALRGLTLVDKDADVLVYYDILEGTELLADGPSFGFGIGSGGYNSAYGVGVRTPTRVKEKKFGKLSVELIDAKSNDVVWRSVSQRQLTETMEPADRDVFVQEQVHKMFEEYPTK
ncbi:DUF4136 domain-containing protein [Vibrio mediterranei]|uniref:DUF4136 domain-containing protein n=1 Tax=Vibrio mediterranei TaxID=689 RepID=UPI0022842325|nr:DUF4136 domain-containing protein [Vibrio mediterranei]MCY9853599.1 DUF4136 domain-containing protein [Vibrio mediterranei]